MKTEEKELLWTTYDLSEAKPVEWLIGNLRLQAKCAEDELWLSNNYVGLEKDPNDRHPTGEFIPAPVDTVLGSQEEDLKWSRWGLGQPATQIELKPLFPDKPIVVRPENSFKLVPGVDACIFVRVPIWVKVCVPSAKDIVLTKLPVIELSYTWFGSFIEGILCYWISSSARRHVKPDLYRNFLVICPIHIKNRSDEDLLVEKLCLHVSGLEMFIDDRNLWSNVTSVSYNGSDGESDIEIISGPPDVVSNAELISTPEDTSTLLKSFSAKTFLALQNIPGIGTHIR